MSEMQKPVLEHTPAEARQEKELTEDKPYHEDTSAEQVSQGFKQEGLDSHSTLLTFEELRRNPQAREYVRSVDCFHYIS